MKLKIGIFASSLSTAATFVSNFLLSTIDGKIFGINSEQDIEQITTLGSSVNDLEYDSDNNKYFAVGNGGTIYLSEDSNIWTTISTPTSKNINVIKYADDVYFLGVDND